MRKWREMSADEFRKNAMEEDKSSGFLTVDEVLTTKGFEHLSKKEAKEYIETVERYCLMMYQLYLATNQSSNNTQNIAA